LIDYFAKEYFNVDFDRNGELASKGSVCNEFLNKLKEIGFIRMKPPKSTGRELFSPDLIKKILNNLSSNINAFDTLWTLTEYTAWSIAENIRQFAPGFSTIIASGGGVYNNLLMNLLKSELPQLTVKTTGKLDIDPNLKEALAFAFLAYLTAAGLPGNMPSVTGAERECILGGIFNI
jgi:anhydro-N-acetylmuramic acid kinase